MSTLNKVMLIGNLGDDVKMHYFDGGNCVGRFPIATSESYTSKQTGERIQIQSGTTLLYVIKQLRFVKNTLKKEIKYMLKGVLNQGNGKVKMEIQDIQQRFKYKILHF